MDRCVAARMARCRSVSARRTAVVTHLIVRAAATGVLRLQQTRAAKGEECWLFRPPFVRTNAFPRKSRPQALTRGVQRRSLRPAADCRIGFIHLPFINARTGLRGADKRLPPLYTVAGAIHGLRHGCPRRQCHDQGCPKPKRSLHVRTSTPNRSRRCRPQAIMSLHW